MLENIFLQILSMSAAGGAAALCVLLLRLIFRRAPRGIIYAMWAVVLIRLLCPFGIPLPAQSGLVAAAPPDSAAAVAEAVSEAAPAPSIQREAVSPAAVCAGIWLIGAAALLGRNLWSYVRLRRRLSGASALGGGVFVSENAVSPFVLGFFRPRIYLPASLGNSEWGYILAHERRHIARGDHITRVLALLALCLHWFNPLVWAAFIISARDMELSCDEAVIRELGVGIRADYCASLLKLASGREPVLAFGEVDTAGRIRNLATLKKPPVLLTALAVIICAAAAFWLLAEPGSGTELLSFENERGRISVQAELPDGFSITPDISDPGALSTFALTHDGVKVGTLTLYGLATTDGADLEQVDPSADELPMQIFATVALSNHAGYDGYDVVRSWKSGAVATAEYVWQDLSQIDSYGAAAAIPYQQAGCLLAYDWELMDCFIELRLAPGAMDDAGLRRLAESLEISMK